MEILNKVKQVYEMLKQLEIQASDKNIEIMYGAKILLNQTISELEKELLEEEKANQEELERIQKEKDEAQSKMAQVKSIKK